MHGTDYAHAAEPLLRKHPCALLASGTTAHVGITLYGMANKSGHRHLDSENAFQRNSLDIFQIATEQSLGSIWKIRVWHDNKGEVAAAGWAALLEALGLRQTRLCCPRLLFCHLTSLLPGL